MAEPPNDYIGKRKTLGMFVLGVCVWTMIIGLGWMVIKDVGKGFVIFAVGATGFWVGSKAIILFDEAKESKR